MADDSGDLRLQAAEWRVAARRFGGSVGHALDLAAGALEDRADSIDRSLGLPLPVSLKDR